MADNTTVRSGGMGFLGWLFIAFLVLKLGVGDTAVEDWSWWWVTAPLWGPLTLALALAIFGGLCLGLARLVESEQARKRRKSRKAINDLSRTILSNTRNTRR